jgi:hypothetical protein
MAAITLTEVKNANQLQYVSSLEAFNGDEPFTGREFAVPSGEMLFDVDGVLNSNSELIVYLREMTEQRVFDTAVHVRNLWLSEIAQ